MAGLNDDVDDDLDPFVEPPDENPDSSPAPNIVLMNKTGRASKSDNDPNAIKPSQLFGGPIVPGELPNLKDQFLILTDTTNKISDNRALKQSLKESCSICKEDAQLVNGVVPGFISESRPLNTFTTSKSKVGLNETLNALDVQLEADVEQLRMAVEETTKTLIENFKRNNDHIDRCLTKALTSYQPVLAKMILLVDGGDGADEVAQFLSVADNTYGFETDILSEKFPETKEYIGIINNVDFWKNASYVVRRNTSEGTRPVNLFYYDDDVHELSETEPFFKRVDGDTHEIGSRNRVTLLTVIRNGLDMDSLQYFKHLNQISHNITNAMGESLSLVGQLATKAEATPKERLDTLTQIAALNNRYAKHNIALLSFTKMYFDALDWLYASILAFGGRTPALSINLNQDTPTDKGEQLPTNPKVVTTVV
jgi:hypothetical protein